MMRGQEICTDLHIIVEEDQQFPPRTLCTRITRQRPTDSFQSNEASRQGWLLRKGHCGRRTIINDYNLTTQPVNILPIERAEGSLNFRSAVMRRDDNADLELRHDIPA